MSEPCHHPLEDRTVVGNADPFDRGADGVFRVVKFDARCDACGESIPLYYRLSGHIQKDMRGYSGP